MFEYPISSKFKLKPLIKNVCDITLSFVFKFQYLTKTYEDLCINSFSTFFFTEKQMFTYLNRIKTKKSQQFILSASITRKVKYILTISLCLV